MADQGEWPALPLSAWKDTRDTLHLYTQIVGKVRLALTPVERERANVPFYLTPRGLTTSGIPQDDLLLQIDFDFVRHAIDITTSDGRGQSIPLVPARCVADIYAALMAALSALDIHVKIWPKSVEVANPTFWTEDRMHDSYDPEYAHRFWQVLVRVGSAFMEHRASFRGRHTPVHFFGARSIWPTGGSRDGRPKLRPTAT